MGFIERIGKQKRELSVTASSSSPTGFEYIRGYSPLREADIRLYDSMREAIPVIDAAISMSVRLCGGFTVKSSAPAADAALKKFKDTVMVGATGAGLEAFLSTYLSGLLTYGNAVAEIIPTWDENVCALYNADLKNLEIREKNGGMTAEIWVKEPGGSKKLRYPGLIAFTALDPPPGRCTGVSVLRGLPFVSGILLNVFETVGKNWEKAGNVRYAVTYKPGGDPLDKAYAKDRARSIAEEWGRAMRSRDGGDFVAVGDVSVKVIGAESAIPDSSVPVRQLMEQIISKLGVPPYILGLSWSSTERMSGEQADIFTSLLTSYRRAVTPALEQICRTYLRLAGVAGDVTVEWGDINLKDELCEAQAAYYRARAAEAYAGAGESGAEDEGGEDTKDPERASGENSQENAPENSTENSAGKSAGRKARVPAPSGTKTGSGKRGRAGQEEKSYEHK